jgi:hypothetical protein
MPTSSNEKKKWLNLIVGGVLNKIVPNSSKHIFFALLGSRNLKFILLIKIKTDSKV